MEETKNKSRERLEVVENRELELKLGPPGEVCQPLSNSEKVSLKQQPKPSFLQHQWLCKGMVVKEEEVTLGPNNSYKKRLEEGPIMGWPPVRSYRKIVARRRSSFSKTTILGTTSNTSPKSSNINGSSENLRDGYYVKVNMDGVPIGRKIDLQAYHNYQQLYSAVDDLFRGLLAAQSDTSLVALKSKMTQEMTEISESKEYALVYEDDEGDRVLVGDVPWHMFVSTATRLRLLKKSEVAELQYSSSKLSKIQKQQENERYKKGNLTT